MASLTAHGHEIRSVFDLLGSKEPALTAALGFVLATSDRLRSAFLTDLDVDGGAGDVSIEQHSRDGLDRTDIELVGHVAHVIVEAKRGWVVPTRGQLETYAARAPTHIVVITDCTDSYASRLGLPEEIDEVPVLHRSWRQVLDLVRAEAGAGRRWEPQLLRYLEGNVATLQDVESNQVYCVSLGPIAALDNTHGREFVEDGLYFHPHIPGWPQHPPTYVGFRYHSGLQTIRHVDAYEVVADLRDAVPNVTVTQESDIARPHLVYHLGPHIGPNELLAYGTNYRAARHWVFLDLLLTSATYRDAVEASAARRSAAGLS